MSDLKVVSDEPTPLEKRLLEASRAEQPSEEHKARLRAALGIGPAPLGAAAAPPAETAHAPPAAPSSLRKYGAFPQIVAGLCALGLVAGWALSRRSDESPPVRSQSAPTFIETAKPALLPAPISSLLEASPSAAPSSQTPPAPVSASSSAARLPNTRSPVSAPRATPSGPARDSGSTGDPGSDLSEQMRLIEAARAGVAARDVSAARAALDSYAERFPRGSFGQEAMVLRIRVLDQAGDSARATALARAFLTRFPDSPHVARLKPIAERGASR